MTFTIKFALRDPVHIDGDMSLRGFVTALQFRAGRDPLVGISYIHNGEAREVWIEEWRVSKNDLDVPQ